MSCQLIDVSSLFQQFGKIIDVEIIFNERGSKVRITTTYLNHHCHIEKKNNSQNIFCVNKQKKENYIINFDKVNEIKLCVKCKILFDT